MKRIMAKVGTYTKDGKEKGEYVKVGVILENANGEYILFDPSVNISGIMLKQQVNGIAKNGSDSVIASIFTDEPKSAPQMAQDAQATNTNNTFDDDIDW